MQYLHRQLPRRGIRHRHLHTGVLRLTLHHLGQNKLQVRRGRHTHHPGLARTGQHRRQRGGGKQATATKRWNHARMVAQRLGALSGANRLARADTGH